MEIRLTKHTLTHEAHNWEWNQQDGGLGGSPQQSSHSNNNLAASHREKYLCGTFRIQVETVNSWWSPRPGRVIFVKSGPCPVGRFTDCGPNYRPKNDLMPLGSQLQLHLTLVLPPAPLLRGPARVMHILMPQVTGLLTSISTVNPKVTHDPPPVPLSHQPSLHRYPSMSQGELPNVNPTVDPETSYGPVTQLQPPTAVGWEHFC